MSVATRDDHLPDNWVPVEQRWLGLDRRTIWPGIVAIIFVILAVGVLPAIDQAIDYDRQIEAGDVIDLGAGVTIVPPVGWGLPNGLLVSEQSVSGEESALNLGATLEHGAVTVTIQTGAFSGTPDELLTQITDLNETFQNIDNSKATSSPTTVVSNSGITGVAQAFVGVNVEGVIAAYVVDGIGIEIVAQGPNDTLLANSDALVEMFNSLAYTKPEEAS